MTNEELDRAAMVLEARAHWQAKRREARLAIRFRLGLADRLRGLARRLERP